MKSPGLFIKALSVLLSILFVTSVFTVLPAPAFAAEADTAAAGDGEKGKDDESDPSYIEARFYRGGNEYYGGKSGFTRFYQGDDETDISVRVFDENMNDLSSNAEFIWMYGLNQGMIQMYTPVGISADALADTYRPLMGQSEEFWQYADENGGEWSYDLIDWSTMPNDTDFIEQVFGQSFDGVDVSGSGTMPVFSRDEISDWYSGSWFTQDYIYSDEPAILRENDQYCLAITAIVRYQKSDGSYLYACAYGSSVVVTDTLTVSGSLMYAEDEWNSYELGDGDTVEYSTADESSGLYAENAVSSTGLRYLWFYSASQPEEVSLDAMTPVGIDAGYWDEYKESLSGGKGKDGEESLSLETIYRNHSELWSASAMMPLMDYSEITDGHPELINEEDGVWLACAAAFPVQGKTEEDEITLLSGGFIGNVSVNAKIGTSATIRFYDAYDMTYEANRAEAFAELIAGVKKAPEGELTYQWYRVTDSGDTAVDGATELTYHAPLPDAGESVSYYCAAACGGVTGRSDNFTVTRTAEWNTNYMSGPIGDFTIGYDVSRFSVYPNMSSTTYWRYIDPMKSMKVYRVTGDSYEGGTEVSSGYSGGYLYITDNMEQGETRRYYIYFKTTNYQEFRSDIFSVTKQVENYDPTLKVKDLRVKSIFDPAPLYAVPAWRGSESGIYQYIGAETYAYFFTEDTSTTYSLSDLTVAFYRCDNDDGTGNVTELSEVTAEDLSAYPRVNDYAAIDCGLKCLLPSDTAGTYYVYAEYTATVEGETVSGTTFPSRVTVEDVGHDDYFRFDEETGTITGYYGYEDTITYPAEINGIKVKRIRTTELTDDSVKNNSAQLNGTYKTCLNAVLPEGLEQIAPYTFLGEKYIEEISVPNTVTRIGRYSFYHCYRLKTVTAGNKDDGSFGSQLTRLEKGTFANMDSLEKLDFGCCFSRINQQNDPSDLPRVNLVNSFIGLPNLTDFIAPEQGSMHIESGGNPTPFYVSSKLKHIGSAKNLEIETPSGNNTAHYPHIYFMTRDGQDNADYDDDFVYYPDEQNDGWIIGGLLRNFTSTNTTVTFPDSYKGKYVTGIGAGGEVEYRAMHFSNRPERVLMGDHVKSIGASAFENSDRLTEVTLPLSLKRIGSRAFGMTTQTADVTGSLTSINLCDTQLEFVGDRAFYQQKLCDFGDLEFASGASIGDEAFALEYLVTDERTDRLTSVTVGGAAHIGYRAFYNRFTLRSVNVSGSLKLDQDAFDKCYFLDTVTHSGAIRDGDIVDNTRGFSHLRYTLAAPSVTDTELFTYGDGVKCSVSYNRSGDYAYKTLETYTNQGTEEEPNWQPTGEKNSTMVLYLKFGEANIYIPATLGEDEIDTVDFTTLLSYIEAGHVIVNSGATDSGDPEMGQIDSDFVIELNGAYTYTLYIADGIKMLKNKDSSIYTNLKNCTALRLPNTITEIPDGLFSNGQIAGTVEIPASVTRIGDKAFARNKIDSLILHEGLESIGFGAFACGDANNDPSFYSYTPAGEDDCRQIGSIKTVEKGEPEGETLLPDSLMTLSYYAFADCSFGGKLTLPCNLQNIYDGAFFGTNVTEVHTDGPSLQTFGDERWTGNENLAELVSAGVFGNCSELRVIDLSEAEVRDLGALSFNNSLYGYSSGVASDNIVNKAVSLKLPRGLKNIGFNALRGIDTSLIQLPEELRSYNVEYLSNKINGKAAADSSITVPSTVAAVHDSIFNLGEVTFRTMRGERTAERGNDPDFYGNLLWTPVTNSNGIWSLEVSDHAPANITKGSDEIAVFFTNRPRWNKVYVNCVSKSENLGTVEKYLYSTCTEMTYLETDEDGYDVYVAAIQRPHNTYPYMYFSNDEPMEVGVYRNNIDVVGKYGLTGLPASIPDGRRVRCYEDSCIHDWCESNNISYELIPSQPITLSLRVKSVGGIVFRPEDFTRIDWVDDTDGTLLTSNTLVCPVHEHQSGHKYKVRLWLNDSYYEMYDLAKGADFTFDPDGDSFSPVQEIILEKKGTVYVTGTFGDQIHIDGFTVSAYSIMNNESTHYEDERTDYDVTLNPDGSFFVEVPKSSVTLEAAAADSEPYLPLTVRNIAYKTKGADKRIDLGYLTIPKEQIIDRIPVTHRVAGVTRVISADGSKQSEARIVVISGQYYFDLTDLRGVFEIGDEADILVSDSAATGGYEPYRLTLPGERSEPAAITLTPAQNAKVILPAHNYHVKLGAYDGYGRLFAYTTANSGTGDVLYLPAGGYTLIAFQNSAKNNITLPDTLAEFEDRDYDIAGYAKEEVTLASGQEYTFASEVPSAVVSSAVSASFSANPGLADKATGSYPVYLHYSVEESARHGDITFRLKPLAWKDTPFTQVDGKYAYFSGTKGVDGKFEVAHADTPNTRDEHYLEIITDAYEGVICFYVRPTGQPIKLYINGAYKMIYTIPASTFALSPPNPATSTPVNSLTLKYSNAVDFSAKVYVDGEENSVTGLVVGAANKARLSYTLPVAEGSAEHKITVKVFDSEDKMIWSSYTYSVTYSQNETPVPKKLDIRVTNYNASADGVARVENAGYDFMTGEYKKMRIFVSNENYNSDGTFAKVISFNYSLEVEHPDMVAYNEIYLNVWCNEDDPQITEVTLTYSEASGRFEGSMTWPAGYKTVDDLPYGFDLNVPTEKAEQQVNQEALDKVNEKGDLMSAELDEDVKAFYEEKIDIDEFRFILENGEYMEGLTEEERQAFRELTAEDIDMFIDLADAKNEITEAYNDFSNSAILKMQGVFANDHVDDINSYYEAHGVNAIKTEPEADTEGKLLTLGYKKHVTDYGVIYIFEDDDKTVLTSLDPRFSYIFANNSHVLDSLKGKGGKDDLAGTGSEDDLSAYVDKVWDFYDEYVASWSTVRDISLEIVSMIDLCLGGEMSKLTLKLAAFGTKLNKYASELEAAQNTEAGLLRQRRTERTLAAIRNRMTHELSGTVKFNVNGEIIEVSKKKSYGELFDEKVVKNASKEMSETDKMLDSARKTLRQLLREGPDGLSKAGAALKTLSEGSFLLKAARLVPFAGAIIGMVFATIDLIELASKGYEVLKILVQEDPTHEWLQLYVATVLYGDVFGLNIRNLPENEYWNQVDHRFDKAKREEWFAHMQDGTTQHAFYTYSFNDITDKREYEDNFGSYMRAAIYAKDSSRSFLDLTDDFEKIQSDFAKEMIGYLDRFESYYHRQTSVVISNFVLAVGGFCANPYVTAVDLAGLVIMTWVGYENSELFTLLKDGEKWHRELFSRRAERFVKSAFVPSIHHYNVYQDWLNIFVPSSEWGTDAYKRIVELVNSRRQEYTLPHIAHYSEIGNGYLYDEEGNFIALSEEYRKKVMQSIECDMDIFATLGIEPNDPEYDFSNIDFGELDDEAAEGGANGEPEYNTPTPCPIDPSGYVYEAVASNRIQGAEAKIYYRDKDGSAKLWDEAEEYDEINPQTTDFFGEFGWMTPVGKWKVVVTKDGYETADSTHDPAADAEGWLPVPPPQTNVNIGLVSTAAPTVGSVTATADRIQLVFSQYMDIAALEADNSLITVSQGGENIPVSFEFADREESPTSHGVYYGRILNITRADGESFAEDALSIRVRKQFVNYAGTAFADDYTAADLELRQIAARIIPGYDKGITVTAGAQRTISVTVKDDSGYRIAGETITMSAAYGDLLTPGNTTAVTDENGEAVFTVTGERFGIEVLTFSAENGVSATASACVSNKEPVLLGDADGDGTVTILDATAIQRKLADFSVSSFSDEAALITGKKLDIIDATAIQRWLAGFASAYTIGKDV